MMSYLRGKYKDVRKCAWLVFKGLPTDRENNLEKNTMGTRLYVGGISYSTNDAGLNAHFAQAGTVVSAQIITDRETGRSKGFGFVEMGSDEEAQNAIAMFHGKELDGRNLTVNEARPKTDAPRDGGFRR